MNESNYVRTFVLTTNQAMKTQGTYLRGVTDLADGQMALVNSAGLCYDSNAALTATTTPVRFGVRNGSDLLYTPFFTLASLTTAKKTTYVHGRNQISYIGYNTSSGSFEVIDDNQYQVNLTIHEWDMAGCPPMIKFGTYLSDATATQAEIAKGLCTSLVNNFSREAHQDIIFSRVYSGAVTNYAWVNDYLTFTVIKESQYITPDSGDAATWFTTASVSADTILSLGGIAFIVESVDTSTGVTKLDMAWPYESGTVIWDDTASRTISVYNGSKAATLGTSIATDITLAAGAVIYLDIAGKFYKARMTNATTGVLLDQPYQGTTDAAALIGGGTAAAVGNWGIRCETQNREFAVETKPYNKLRFEIQFEDMGTTTGPTYTTSVTEGSGTYEYVACNEWFCQHAEGKRYNNDKGSAPKRALAVSTSLYNIATLHYENSYNTGSMAGSVVAKGEIVVAIPEAWAAAGAMATTLLGNLDTTLNGQLV